jgi:Fur family ferric uptake transcriptional regulator
MEIQTSDPSLAQQWIEQLKDSGYRISHSLRAVVEILANTQRALNAIQIFDLARAAHPSLGLVSVYRTLDKLEQLNLIQRVHQPDGCHAYLPAFHGHQHLLLCRQCGLVLVFEGDDIGGLISRVERESGYQVHDHWLQLFGTCSSCQAKLITPLGESSVS